MMNWGRWHQNLKTFVEMERGERSCRAHSVELKNSRMKNEKKLQVIEKE